MADLDLDAIEARADAATPGPWSLRGRSRDVLGGTMYGDLGTVATVYQQIDDGRDCTRATLDFIATSREDVPALVAECRRAAGAIRSLHESVAMLLGMYQRTSALLDQAMTEGLAACEALRAQVAAILTELAPRCDAEDCDALATTDDGPTFAGGRPRLYCGAHRCVRCSGRDLPWAAAVRAIGAAGEGDHG